jgi:PTS system nitrogen regulatory IIA component
MKIYELLKEGHIVLALKPGSKEYVLGEFVAALEKRGLISKKRSVLDELLKREKLKSTGMEKGIAVPHALVKNIKEPVLALALVKKGVDFEAPDKKPTHVILLLLGNKNKPSLQLRWLAHICRLIKETKFVEAVKKARTSREVCSILKKEEGKI